MKEEKSEKEERNSNTTIRTAISGQNLFGSCDDKRETRTSCDRRNDCGKTTSKYVEWTNKEAQSRTGTEALKAQGIEMCGQSWPPTLKSTTPD